MPSLEFRSFSLQALLLLTAVAAPLLASCGGGSSSPGVPPGPSFTQYAVSNGMAPSGPITVGSDGALWLIATSKYGNQGSLSRVTTTGAATMEFSSDPSQIVPFGACTTGSDAAVWFFTIGAGFGRITPSGNVRFFPLPTNAYVQAMTVGPDGAVWFTDTGTHALGRITTAGAVTEYPTTLLPYLSGGIATGPDGALWFTSYAGRPTPGPP